MSDDPETARQIDELARDARPLLVLDVDEVVLEFVRPFTAFLGAEGYDLRTASFRLYGNVVAQESGDVASRETVSALLDGFFAAQEAWQTPAEHAIDTITGLADAAEIVMLTAMPHRHRAARRRLLDRLGLPYPLLTTEAAKGPALGRLRGESGRPVAFVDDIPHNLISVRESLPDAGLVHLMAHAGMRALLPPLDDDIHAAETWPDAGAIARRHLGI
ncbi:MAG: hypothetical protein R3D45_08925 [Rhizobiaceae bacterium]